VFEEEGARGVGREGGREEGEKEGGRGKLIVGREPKR
jgi:hypothetical protein